MAAQKRKRLKRSTFAKACAPAKVHDRRAAVSGISVVPAEVDDPYALNPGDKIVVMRATRDDPLAAMYAAGQVDEAQNAAGQRWRLLNDATTLRGICAIDPTKEPVDGGQIAQAALSDAQLDAVEDLARARKELGYAGHTLICDILGLGLTVREAAAKRCMYQEADRKYLGKRFRECLSTLAACFGLAARRLDKRAAGYNVPPKPVKRACGLCTHFQDEVCAIVAGDISEVGTCNFFGVEPPVRPDFHS